MSQTITATQGADLIDALLGIRTGSRLDGLRKGRAEAGPLRRRAMTRSSPRPIPAS